MPGLEARQSNMEMSLFSQSFTVGSHDIDAGYVTDNKNEMMWLYNGTDEDAVVTGITASGESGGISFNLDLPAIIPAKEAIALIFTISKYGSTEFEASFMVVSSCALQVVPINFVGTRPFFATEQPLPISISEAMHEALLNASTGETFYDTLEFIELSSGAAVRVVHSDEDLNTPQGLFTACKFGCKHPETEGGIVGTMQITVDFLPLDAQEWLVEKCKTGTGITVYWRQYLGPDMEPDAYYPVPLDITAVEQSITGATITASFPMLTAMKFPRRLMTTTVLPGGLT